MQKNTFKSTSVIIHQIYINDIQKENSNGKTMDRRKSMYNTTPEGICLVWYPSGVVEFWIDIFVLNSLLQYNKNEPKRIILLFLYVLSNTSTSKRQDSNMKNTTCAKCFNVHHILVMVKNIYVFIRLQCDEKNWVGTYSKSF